MQAEDKLMKDATNRLFSMKDAYDIKGTNDLFVEALRDKVAFHMKHCRDYAQILRSFSFHVSQLKSISDIYRLPALPTSFFKKNPLYSMPAEKMRFVSQTSGTTGKPLAIGLDNNAIPLAAKMLFRLIRTHELISFRPSRHIIMGFKPVRGVNKGFVRTAHAATFLAPSLKKTYAFGPYQEDGDYYIDFDMIANMLETYSEKNAVVRIFGQSAFLYYFLSYMEENNRSVSLNEKSLIMVGGGFKEFYQDRVSGAELYELARLVLGLPGDRVQEIFGVVEHSIPYFQCRNHHFHIPVYARVLVRDFNTLAPLGFGQAGLLNLITPLLGSMPLSSVLTDDIAVMHDGRNCGCGNEAPYFEVLGRAGMVEIKTCAQAVQTALEGSVR